MKKITWCAVARAPYLDYLLNEVNKHFELNVYYRIKKRTHPWELQPAEYKAANMNGNFIQAVRSILSSNILIMSGWSFWQHLIIMVIPLKHTKKIYWTDTTNVNRKEWIGLKGNIRRLIIKIVFNVFDEVWSTGKPGCEALEKLGCKKEKIRSFGFYFDLSRYSNIDFDKQNRARNFKMKNSNQNTEIIFLCAGKVYPLKKHEDIIKAIAKLNNEKAILWIAGTGVQEEELKSLAKKLNVGNQIKFLGWLQQEEVELAFIGSDVFVHSSLIDAYPIVVLDAMTWAKPIIATHESGSARDRVVHGQSGFLYPTGQIDCLTKHMMFFVNNNDQIEKFGSEARKTACAHSVDGAISMLNNLDK